MRFLSPPVYEQGSGKILPLFFYLHISSGKEREILESTGGPLGNTLY